MKLIDKDALVAEIEKLKGKISDSSSYCNGWQHALRILELSIDTLEVKEVDLEKSVSDWLYEGLPNDEELIDYIKETAKHFFELGLSSQLSWKDIERIAEIGMDFMSSEDSDNLNDEEYYTEILNRFKMQKGEEV